MNALVLGNKSSTGGREASLAAKLTRSKLIETVFSAPGNPYTALIGENVDLSGDHETIWRFVRDNNINLVIPGPEDMLVGGITDSLAAHGFRHTFGPSKKAMELSEASKAATKLLLHDAGVPTSEYRVVCDIDSAYWEIKIWTYGYPLVIKADGLAAGKGVVICDNQKQAEQALDEIMVKRVHGDAGKVVVIEQYVPGPEASVHAICNGRSGVVFPLSVDHKGRDAGNAGPNTGGMGVLLQIPSTPDFAKLQAEAQKNLVAPILREFRTKGAPFRGFLYPGLKIDRGHIKSVLEINSRGGDPETQVYMAALGDDLAEVCLTACAGDDASRPLSWKAGVYLLVVIAAPGYPTKPIKGGVISGIEDAEKIPGVEVVHAGTAWKNGQLVVAGGRVLNVIAHGPDFHVAYQRAYEAADKIHFEGGHHLRRDIGLPQPQ